MNMLVPIIFVCLAGPVALSLPVMAVMAAYLARLITSLALSQGDKETLTALMGGGRWRGK
ncbi:MAG: hypothetical protein HRF47_13805 [Chloroflexota bacterium]|jgi:hypothetical protein